MTLDLYKELSKNISFARSEAELLIQPDMLNPWGIAHGGELMKLMDTMAGIAARKHCKGNVVTKSFHDIVFHKPIQLGDVITVIAQLAYVGNSSMNIFVNIYVHDMEDFSNPSLAASSFVTMIHLVDQAPNRVPRLEAKTPQEEALFKLGEEKYKAILKK